MLFTAQRHNVLMRTFLPTTNFPHKTHLILMAVDFSLSEIIYVTQSLTLVLEDWVLRVHIPDSTCAGHFDPATYLPKLMDWTCKGSKADLNVNFPLFTRKIIVLVLSIFYFKIYVKKIDNWQCFHVPNNRLAKSLNLKLFTLESRCQWKTITSLVNNTIKNTGNTSFND